MTIRECMDFTLQLLNQYTIAGSPVPLTYNDQADTENRMLNLINDAQMQIATTTRPIPDFIEVEIPPIPSYKPLEYIPQHMPSEFIHQTGVFFTPLKGHNRTPVDASRYKWLSDETILLPNQPAGTYRIEFARFPLRFTPETDPDTQLENKPDTHEIIPYYVAAMIALDENPKLYYSYYNVWETRLSRLGYKPAHAVAQDVVDVYRITDIEGLPW